MFQSITASRKKMESNNLGKGEKYRKIGKGHKIKFLDEFLHTEKKVSWEKDMKNISSFYRQSYTYR